MYRLVHKGLCTERCEKGIAEGKRMKQKKGIYASCLACILIVAAIVGICLLQVREPDQVPVAENCGQLKLFIRFPYGVEKVNIWQNEEGVYYFFLPSGTGDCRFTLGNIGDDGNVRIGGETFGPEDDLNRFVNALPHGQVLEATVNLGGITETICVVFLRSENIPAMFIDTESGSVENIHADKEVKEAASMRLVDSAGNGYYTGSMEYIKTRGNSTWQDSDKKPYQIKLDKEAELLGMAAAKKWILLANALDDTLIKNAIVYRYAESYSTVPSISGQYVDLYINGDYAGNYYLCEKVETGRNRLPLTDLEAATEAVNPDSRYRAASLYASEDGRIKATQGLEDPTDITGGYLVEHITEQEYINVGNAFQTIGKECYRIISPSPATVEQAEYICGLFDEMERAMDSEDGINPDTGRHFSEYLDVESWASKYVMEEVFHNPDAVVASMYMYKDCDSVDPLIHCGPMWDYDRALGSYGSNVYYVDNARQVGHYGIYVEQLMNFEEVASLVYEKFENEMLPYVDNKVRADIFDLDQMIRASAEMDAARWGEVHGYYPDRDASLDYLTWFLEEKTDYLQDVWFGGEEYCTVTFLDYYEEPCGIYQVKRGECLSETPIVNTHIAIFAGWYMQGSNIPYSSGLPVLMDATYESRWIEMDLVLQNALAFADMDLSQADPVVFEDFAEMIRQKQEEAQEEGSQETGM